MGYWTEALAFALRWLHVVAAIAWIGESFYFVALDRGLAKPKSKAPGLFGESWSVHGGGFYLKQKFMPAPAELPDDLHWSKWKSYTTWMSGFALLCLVYLTAPNLYLVDPKVLALSNSEAVLAALLLLLGSWLIYDLACKVFAHNEQALSVAVLLFVLGLCLASTHVFSGRAAFLLTGAALATCMSANVFFVIIPGQKRLVQALAQGGAINPEDGLRGKQRSVHNTYFTLPVVFTMLSSHWGPAYADAHRGWLLFVIVLGAAMIREFFVRWHSGQRTWPLLASGFALMLAVVWYLAPRPVVPAPAAPNTASSEPGTAAIAATNSPPTLAELEPVFQKHCRNCHSSAPTIMPVAPKGMVLDTPEQWQAQRALIRQQVVVARIMPLGNLTQISEAERELIQRWADAP
ncbi:urate hydroxylase PuuD [Ahniella affigens]|nr:urate hydroxylase PuuD [Ahniella affigens]